MIRDNLNSISSLQLKCPHQGVHTIFGDDTHLATLLFGNITPPPFETIIASQKQKIKTQNPKLNLNPNPMRYCGFYFLNIIRYTILEREKKKTIIYYLYMFSLPISLDILPLISYNFYINFFHAFTISKH